MDTLVITLVGALGHPFSFPPLPPSTTSSAFIVWLRPPACFIHLFSFSPSSLLVPLLHTPFSLLNSYLTPHSSTPPHTTFSLPSFTHVPSLPFFFLTLSFSLLPLLLFPLLFDDFMAAAAPSLLLRRSPDIRNLLGLSQQEKLWLAVLSIRIS